MAGLILNGITLSVAAQSVERQAPILVGEPEQRAFSGKLIPSIRARKENWRLKTPALIQSDAQAYRGLIQGLGHSWSFDSDLYSDLKGLGPSSGTGTITASGKYGSYLSVASGVTVSYDCVGTPSDTTGVLFPGVLWGAIAWKRLGDGTTWQHYILAGGFYRNGAALTTEYTAGYEWMGVDFVTNKFFLRAHDVYSPAWTAATAFVVGATVKPSSGNGRYYRATSVTGDAKTAAVTEPTWPTTYGNTVVDNHVTWTDQGVVALKVDDVAFFPYSLLSTWPALIYTEANARAWMPHPKLRLTGDLVTSVANAGIPAMVVEGMLSGAQLVPHDNAGWQAAGESLEFTLAEV